MNEPRTKGNLLDRRNDPLFFRAGCYCRCVLIFALINLCSCSLKTFAPTGLGALGGGLGALGGPATAFAGAGLGAAAGQIIKESDEVKQSAEKLKAFSEGDVQKLIELKLKEERGWLEKTIDGIYDILMISAAGMVLYFIFHFLRVRNVTKKVINLEQKEKHHD